MPDAPTPSPWTSSWNPQIELESPAGQTIREFIQLVPAGTRLTLFGSAPLQICLDAGFFSEDVDCFGPSGDLCEMIERSGAVQR
jgi:hypothetical protein